ncbi:MAG: GNAT family N-acetyltransferase [Flavobacteriales bacterium]|jgi:N-acetylglutamate synthase-like GNAT family acetyltransferase
MIEIRRATKNDINSLTMLFDSYRVFYKNESNIVNAEKFISERLIQEDSVFYVGLIDSISILGFVQLYPIFSSTKMQRLWVLNDLFVDKNQRGKGITKELK